MTTTASQDEIVQILTALKINGVKSVALTTMEGRSLGSTVLEAGPRFKLGALSAASIAIAGKTAAELSLGDLDQIQILGSTGALILGAIGNKALLSVVTERVADFTPLIQQMKKVSLRLSPML
ncbi:MAG: hypothetical protein ABI779_03060 [Acidobacteriota bacterium]